jgi:hypothetical protein
VFFLFPGCVFNSLGSEQTKIYRAKILLCCGAMRVITKFEVRLSTFFLGGGLVRLPLETRRLDAHPSCLKSNRNPVAGIAVCLDKAVPLA